MKESGSYRTILRSSSIMGAASVINILSGLLRMKIVALLLGPTGVGLFGLYQNVVSTGATVASLGLSTVGTRQIADALGSQDDVAAARSALSWGTLTLALISATIFYLLRRPIAKYIFADPQQESMVGWLAFGLALTVMGGSQTALLNGLRRIGDMARIQVASGVLGTIFGVAAMWFWPERGILLLVLTATFANFALGYWYCSKLEPIAAPASNARMIAKQVWGMVRLGVAFMFGAMVTGLGNLIVRSLVQHRLGLEELGHFQAAWNIGMTYLSFVLGAMATDYYPRLSACIKDKPAACLLINQQTEIALLLGAPIILALIATGPCVIWLLYSAEFAPAVEILRWQLLGDIFKVLSWPLGFALLAAGAGKTFVLTETIASSVFVVGVSVGLGLFGVQSTGIAFLAMYCAYLPLVFWIAKRRLNFAWTRDIIRQATYLSATSALVSILGHISNVAAAIVGLMLALAFGVHAFARLGEKTELRGLWERVATLRQRLHRDF